MNDTAMNDPVARAIKVFNQMEVDDDYNYLSTARYYLTMVVDRDIFVALSHLSTRVRVE